MVEANSPYLVIGSGLAGLTFALEASKHGDVTVLTKAQVTDANTSYAQGGIAAAIGEADSWKMHEQDTLIAGDGLCDPAAVRFLVTRAPESIEWLASLGARFDLADDGDFSLGREGGHSRHRIVHHLDKTGWEVERAVVSEVRRNPRIQVVEHAFVTHLLTPEGRCAGASAWIDGLGQRDFQADATLLATGGCGKVYLHTTNPDVATGDGIGLADAVGAKIENMEFMQFHPTTLYHSQLRSFLITEAVRGAGGTLRNHLGRRFMGDYDERLELAPRDVVARAIEAEIKRLDTWCVYLDMTHLDPHIISAEFPTIQAKLLGIGIDITKDWIPVVPAQHYSCGGVVTDLDGQTSIPGLYAAGEVASTGVHGANRLASNSLLEAMVFARAAAERAVKQTPSGAVNLPIQEPPPSILEVDAVRIRKALQHWMTQEVGIVRTNKGLADMEAMVSSLTNDFRNAKQASFSSYSRETWNLLATAQHTVKGALARKKNVGLHFNSDLEN
ncbi:MAG: L-aspartate oxidase [Fimbriimonadaceae bacterium]